MNQAINRAASTRFTKLLAASAMLLTLTATFGAGNAAAEGMAAAKGTVAKGTFSGLSDHITTGGVSVVRTADGIVVKLAKNFSLDGAPDPKVGFGRAGAYDTNGQLAALKSKTGEQSYVVPASVDVDKYDEVYIWCEQFSVPLGVAKIQ